MTVFGGLVLIVVVSQGILGAFIAQRAVMEKIETHLIDKATDTADIIDSKVTAFISFIDSVARTPILQDAYAPYSQKIATLKRHAAFNPRIVKLNITDLQGNCYVFDGRIIQVSDREWFQVAASGKPFVTESYISPTDNKLMNTLAVPVYGFNNKIIGVLSADTPATKLSEDISHIIVGKTGSCFILGLTGKTLAHQNTDLVLKQDNFQETAKTDPSFTSIAQFAKKAMQENTSSIGYYTFKGEETIASYAVMKTTGWKVIVKAPIYEFMGTIQVLKQWMMISGVFFVVFTLAFVFIIAQKMIVPIRKVVTALKDIAQGEGDLTVRLPLIGNDEITELSEYFNQTISKIGLSIKTVEASSTEMTEIGGELASNMTETASAVHQISANIDGVKQQAITQAASVTETAATVEEIIRTIKQLNNSIEQQASSVAQSSSAVEQMVANITSITYTLDKTNDVIKTLAQATADGRETIANSGTVTQKIAEESGSLLEASSVIQHIASQTNLLAMNAAIEAAHAGEAGKGFAVVADEIRKLAEESSAQGKTITATLKALSGEIESLSGSSKTAGDKFNVIFTLSEQVKDMSNRLMEAMREQENGSREVLGAMKTINTVTAEVQAGSDEMLRGGEGAAEEMRKLDDLTRVIADSMNEMASGAVQISNAVQEVNDITQKNKASIENLAQEVKKFKV